MGGAQSQSVDVRIANSSDKTILFRYISEKSYVESQSSTKRAEIGAVGFYVGGELTKMKTYIHTEAPEPEFSSLSPGHDTQLTLDLKGSDIVYVTIKVEHGKVIWNNLQQKKGRNLVITKDLQIKTADDENPFEVHPKDQHQPPSSTSKSTKAQTPAIQRRNISQIGVNQYGYVTFIDSKISDMAVTSNGELLLADSENANIKSLSLNDKTVLSVLSLPEYPTDITVPSSTTAVATANTNTLYIVDIRNTSSLSLAKQVQLKYKVLAITSYHDNLVVTCSTFPRSTKMIDLKGTELRSVSAESQSLVSVPTFSAAALIRIRNMEEKRPDTTAVDKDGTAYMGDNLTSKKNMVCIWSNDFQEKQILLSEKEIPVAVAYSDVTNSLYIAYNSKYFSEVKCFRLKSRQCNIM